MTLKDLENRWVQEGKPSQILSVPIISYTHLSGLPGTNTQPGSQRSELLSFTQMSFSNAMWHSAVPQNLTISSYSSTSRSPERSGSCGMRFCTHTSTDNYCFKCYLHRRLHWLHTDTDGRMDKKPTKPPISPRFHEFSITYTL